MRFVNHQQIIRREKIQQCAGPRAGRTSADVPRVILDAGAKAHLNHHFEVVFRAHLDALGFQQLALLFKLGDAQTEFLADGEDGAPQFLVGGDELFPGKHGHVFQLRDFIPRQRLEAREAFHGVAEKLDAQSVLGVSGAKLDGVAAHAKLAALEGDVVAVVLEGDELFEQLLAREGLPGVQVNEHRLVILAAADAVNARHARHHDHVAPREQAAHGRESEPLDVVVGGGILLDEGVSPWDVGLGLVIIEIADKVFDGIAREKTLELGIKLRRERLVVRDDERGLVNVPDHVGDRERLARTGDAEQHLVLRAGQQTFGQLRNRLRLIPGGRVVGDEFEHAAGK